MGILLQALNYKFTQCPFLLQLGDWTIKKHKYINEIIFEINEIIFCPLLLYVCSFVIYTALCKTVEPGWFTVLFDNPALLSLICFHHEPDGFLLVSTITKIHTFFST